MFLIMERSINQIYLKYFIIKLNSPIDKITGIMMQRDFLFFVV